jgi:hypothetical protein
MFATDTFAREIKISAATLRLREYCILEIDFLPNQKIELYDINQLLNAVYKIGNGKQFKSVVNMGEFTWPDIEAMRLCCSTKGSMHKIATAFVVSNLTKRIISSFLVNLLKPQKPNPVFFLFRTRRKLAENNT